MSWEAWIVVGIAAVLLIGAVTIVPAFRLLSRVLLMRRHLSGLGAGGKVAFWGALIYTISPIDLLPDPIYLDDIAVLGTALMYLTRLWRARRGNVPLPHARRASTGRPPKVKGR